MGKIDKMEYACRDAYEQGERDKEEELRVKMIEMLKHRSGFGWGVTDDLLKHLGLRGVDNAEWEMY